MNKNGAPISFTAGTLIVLMLSAAAAFALEFPDVKNQYPENEFIIGTGEVKASNNNSADKRIAEIMARVEIAKQIRVRIESEMVDTVCEERGKARESDCRNEVTMVIKQTVDEILAGSKIVKYGTEKGTVYAVVVLQKGDTGGYLGKKSADAAQQARESVKRAEAGDQAAMKAAKEQYLKARSYQKGAEALGTPSRSSLLDDLEKELHQLEK